MSELLFDAGFTGTKYKRNEVVGTNRIDTPWIKMPETNWTPPNEFPNLSRGSKIVGLDIESKDLNLHKLGPGFVRKDAHPIGVAIYCDGFEGYYPIRHEHGSNLAKNLVLRWLKDQLKNPDLTIVGANLIYDLEGLFSDGVEVKGKIRDIQIAEPLLDEESLKGYSLDVLAKKYLGVTKDEALMKEAAKLLGIPEKKVKEQMYKLPAQYVGPYATVDARLAVEIYKKQIPCLEKEDLISIFNLESKLVPLLLKMRFKGVPVDVNRAEQVYEELNKKQVELQKRLNSLAGFPVDVWAQTSLSKLAQKEGVTPPQTANKQDSFVADWIKAVGLPTFDLVGEIRKLEKMNRDFVKGFILDMNHDGKLHCQFKQLKKDDGGTRSGRFSSDSPNLQQIPARDEYYGPLIRGLFIPEPGCKWGCADYSAQEPRLTVHYAHLLNLPGAAEAVRQYNEDPNTDYHQMTGDLAAKTSPLFASMAPKKRRKSAKEINLGIPYGMGTRKLAWKLGFITEQQALDKEFPLPDEPVQVMKAYHAAVPFVSGLFEACENRAQQAGKIRTLLGRACHFDFWEPAWGKGHRAYPLDQAKDIYPNERLKRAWTHKALNRLIQGSAADMMKQAMVLLDEAGFVPAITVHDEIDDSYESQAKFEEAVDIMRNAVKISVPLRVDGSLADNWGQAK